MLTDGDQTLAINPFLQKKLASAIANSVASKQGGMFVIFHMDWRCQYDIGVSHLMEATDRLSIGFRNFELIEITGKKLAIIVEKIISAVEAKTQIEMMLNRLEDHFEFQAHMAVPRISAGFVLFPAQAASSKASLIKANIALEKAKSMHICMFDDTMQKIYEDERRLVSGPYT